jgi:hypothetical protein
MITTSRAVAAALVLGATALLGGGNANAATAGNFSPLKSVIADSNSGVQKADWGRRCHRECHIGRHGHRHCTWECRHHHRRWW